MDDKMALVLPIMLIALLSRSALKGGTPTDDQMALTLPIFLIARAERGRQRAIVQRLLLAALPGTKSEVLAVAAISADRSTRLQALADQHMVEEAVKASAGAAITERDELRAFPTLFEAFSRLPADVQAAIFPRCNDPKKGSVAS